MIRKTIYICSAIACISFAWWWFDDTYVYEVQAASPCAVNIKTLEKAWTLNSSERRGEIVDLIYSKKLYEMEPLDKVKTIDIRGEYVRVKISTGMFSSVECWTAKSAIKPK